MIIEDKGFTRISSLEIVGRSRKQSIDGTLLEDWLIVNYNGNWCRVGAGFFGRVDIDFTIPKRAIIIHMVIDEKSANQYLRFPIFEGFDFETMEDDVNE